MYVCVWVRACVCAYVCVGIICLGSTKFRPQQQRLSPRQKAPSSCSSPPTVAASCEWLLLSPAAFCAAFRAPVSSSQLPRCIRDAYNVQINGTNRVLLYNNFPICPRTIHALLFHMRNDWWRWSEEVYGNRYPTCQGEDKLASRRKLWSKLALQQSQEATVFAASEGDMSAKGLN